MKHFILAATVSALSALVVPASAQDRGDMMSYALSHPVDNTSLPYPPALGDSVPQSVALQRVEGVPNFGYFYYGGQPILVDLRTRAIVRIGQ